MKDISLPPTIYDHPGDEDTDDASHTNSTVDTGLATNGSQPLGMRGLGMNASAGHSTVIVKPEMIPDMEKAVADLILEDDVPSGVSCRLPPFPGSDTD